MRTLIQNAAIVFSHSILRNAYLVCQDGLIEGWGQMGQEVPEDDFDCTIDAHGRYLSPGFMDIHGHGGGGADFLDGTEEAYLTALRTHLRGGTTTMLPTISGAESGLMRKSISTFQRIKEKEYTFDDIPHIPGIHLEGPYFSHEQRGAFGEDVLRDPDQGEADAFLALTSFIKRWSMSCELPGAMALGKMLDGRGIAVSLAHSAATTEQVMEAYDHGYRSVTHLYSGCSTVRRIGPWRHGGVVEGAFLIDGMDVEIIADGCHLPCELLKLIVKIKGPDHIALVTDAIRFADGNPPQEGKFTDKTDHEQVIVEKGVAMMPDRSCFYGAIGLANRLVRTMVQVADVDLPSAVRMASLTPARMHGLDGRIGSIARGKDADLLLFDEDIHISAVFLRGREVKL